ncbi:MAG: hypothetical protein V5A18_07020 [Haloarculaceae archaeon]
MLDAASNRPALGTLAVLFGVLVVGCGGYGGTETATVSPAPVPEEPTVAPGVPERGPVDAGTLLAADQGERAERPLRIVDVVTVQGSGQQFSVRRTRERLGPNRTTLSYLYTRGRNVEPLYVSETRNGSGRTVRTTLRNGTVRVNESLPPDLRTRLPPADLTERVVTGGAFELVERVDGRLHLGPRDSLSLHRVLPPAIEDPQNPTALLKVTPAGRITWVALDFEAVHDDRSVTVTILRDVEPLPETATWDRPEQAPPTDR